MPAENIKITSKIIGNTRFFILILKLKKSVGPPWLQANIAPPKMLSENWPNLGLIKDKSSSLVQTRGGVSLLSQNTK